MNRKKWKKLTEEKRRIKVAKFCGFTVFKNKRPWNGEDYYVLNNPQGSAGHHSGTGTYPCVDNEMEAWLCCPDYLNDLNDLNDLNYLNDLNAMHEAEKCLIDDATHNQTNEYCYALKHRCGECDPWCDTITATAAQRAEGFVLTMEPEND